MGFTERFIKITRENELEVLKVLEELGCMWMGSSVKPTDLTPCVNDDEDYLIIQASKPPYLELGFKNFLEYTKLQEITLDQLKEFLPSKLKIVRELKDLDGLVNKDGWVLKFESCPLPSCEHYDWIRIEDNKNKGWDTIFYRLDNDIAEKLKLFKFNFEYKPLRTKEEVLEDLVEKDFKYGEGNFILIQHEHGTWDYMNNMSFKTPGQKYYTIESVKKVADELNEILKNNK